jgi:hypothetical protein
LLPWEFQASKIDEKNEYLWESKDTNDLSSILNKFGSRNDESCVGLVHTGMNKTFGDALLKKGVLEYVLEYSSVLLVLYLRSARTR